MDYLDYATSSRHRHIKKVSGENEEQINWNEILGDLATYAIGIVVGLMLYGALDLMAFVAKLI